MALTRAQLLAGNQSNGVVLSGQPQGVIAGPGITISNTGIISVDSSSVTGLVKLNDPFAYNSYVWPGADGAAGEFLQTDGAGNLSWATPQGFAVVTVQPSPAPSPADIGELWFDCSTGTLNVYQNCVGSPLPNWFNVAQPGKPVDPAQTSASPAFSGGNGTQATPYQMTVTSTGVGTTVAIINTVTVNGLAPYQYVPIVDLNAVTNGGRFSFTNYYANASGQLIFNTVFSDLPTSTPGQNYIAAIRVGYATAYIRASVTVTAVLALSPGTITGTPTVGTPVSYTPGVASGGISPYAYTYEWFRDGISIAAPSANPAYTPVAADVGKTLSVKQVVTDSALATTNRTTTASSVTVYASFPSGVWAPLPNGGLSTNPGGISGIYNGTGTTITVTDCLESAVYTPPAIPSYSTLSKSITAGQTLAVRWTATALCGNANTNTAMNGTVSDGTYVNSYSLVINRVPATINDITDTNVALNATVSKGITPAISGLNSVAYVTAGSGSTGTSIGVSLTPGGPFTPIPAAGSTSFPINNLQTLYVEQTVGSAINTAPGYTAVVRVGDADGVQAEEFTYFAQTVSTAVFPNTALTPSTGPNATPAGVSFTDTTLGPLEGTMSANGPAFWADGSVNLSASNMLLDINGGGFGAGGPINDGETLAVAWLPSYISTLAHDAIANGSFTDTTYTNSYSYQVKKQPAFSLPGDPGNAAKSTQQTTAPFTPDDYNSPVTVSFTNPTTSGAVPMIAGTMQVVVNGGTTTNIVLGTTTITINPGDSLEILGDTGTGVSTTYGMTVTIGSSPAQEWLVTTSAAVPYIVTPLIQSPSNNATGVNPAVNSPAGVLYSADPYDPQDGAPAHNCSDWQVYNSKQDYLTSSNITAVGPAAQTYSAGISASGGVGTVGAPQSPFQGLATGDSNSYYGRGVTSNGQIVTITFTPTTPIPATSVQLGCYNRIGQLIQIQVNGGAFVTATNTTGQEVELVDISSQVTGGQITSIVYKMTHQIGGNESGLISSVIVDGFQLVDGSVTLTVASSQGLLQMQRGDYLVESGATFVSDSSNVNYSPVPGSGDGMLVTAYGAGKWVGYNQDKFMYYSTDGFNWTKTSYSVPAGGFGARALYSNGVYIVALGSDATNGGSIHRSTDGINWTAVYTNTSPGKGVYYVASDGAGKWVACGDNSAQVRSADNGATWVPIVDAGLSATNQFGGVAYGNGVWIIQIFGDTWYTSSDTINWTPNNVPGASYSYISFGNGLFARTSTPSITSIPETSSNGLAWTSGANLAGSNYRNVQYIAGAWIIMGGGNNPVAKTTDFLTYTYGTVLNGARSTSFLTSDGTLILTGTSPSSSPSPIFANGYYDASGSFVSASTSSNKILVKSSLGTWTVGQYVIDRNRQNGFYPTSSAIITVGPVVTQPQWYLGLTTNTFFNAPQSDAFNGNDGSYAGADGSGYIRWTPSTPVTYNTSFEFFNQGNENYQLNGGAPVNFTGTGWQTIATGSGTITTFQLNRSSGAFFSQVRIDGQKLINGLQTQLLTFTDGTDLSSMQTGDNIVEIGGGGDASGSIYAINSGSSPFTITTSSPTGTWSTGAQAVDISRYTTYASIGPISSTNASTAYAAGVLTIAGCATQGMKVGQTISSMNEPDATGVITAISDTSITLSNVTGTWTPAGGQYITTIVGSPVVNVVCDTGNLESYNVAQSLLSTNTKYYARVRYKSQAPVVTSQWSPWNTITTASSFALTPGLAMQGGFFAGQINDGGTIYNLIVAPRATGQYGGFPPTNVQYKNPASADPNPILAQNVVYGKIPQDNAIAQGAPTNTYPAFEWADALTIGGFNDWYIPAKNELEILYYNLKPTLTLNDTASGINPNAVPARASNYTSGTPAQVNNTLFQSGGNEAFSVTDYYWSSSEYSVSPAGAWEQVFSNGYQDFNNKANGYYARAVRRVQA